MTEAALDSWYMLGRQARNLLRQPLWIAIMIVEPMVWLVLYGQLFRRLVELPGFESDSYIQFLAPGVVVMSAFFSASWSGWNTIADLDRGVIERFLATPARPVSLIVSQVVRYAIIGVAKGIILLVVALGLGARIHTGLAGWVVLLLTAALIAAGFSGISHGIALIVRNEDTLIAVVSFFTLPLTFLSATLISRELMPEWMQWAARFNPVNWAVVAAREMTEADTDWISAGWHLALLLGFAALTVTFATWAFRFYRRSL